MQPSLSFKIGDVCFFMAIESTELNRLSVNLDFSTKQLPPLSYYVDVAVYAKRQSTFLLLGGTSLILRVYLVANIPEVAPSVVTRVTVYVVNRKSRPLTCHIEKCKSVRLILDAQYLQESIASFVYT